MRNSHAPLQSPSYERPQVVSYVAWLQKELIAAREKILELELQPAPSLDDAEPQWNRRVRVIRAVMQYVEISDACR